MARRIPHPPLRVLLVSGLLLLVFTACSGDALKAPQASPTPIPTPIISAKPTYQVQRGEMVSELNFPGRIAPVTKQELAFSTSGRVTRVYVQLGESVAQGELLAELETGQNEYDLQRAQINLKIAQLRLELTQLQTPRTSAAYTLTVAIQEQEVALAQIALDELNAAYNSVRLTAPISGTVLSVSITEGSMVEADEPSIVVATLDDLIASANLPPSDMALLTVGMKVTVDPVGRNIPSAEGIIQNLPYPYGSADSERSGNSTEVALDQSPAELGYEVGDMVNLTIILEKKTDALWLPAQAVREFEGRYFVIVQDGESQRRVDVEVGIIEPNRIEIIEGLTEGQVVVAP